MRPKEIGENWEPKSGKYPVHTNFRSWQIRTAKEWGISLHDWDMMPKQYRAEMMAGNYWENMIEAYKAQEIGDDK